MKQLQMSLQMLVRCRHLGLNLNLLVLVYLKVESLKAFQDYGISQRLGCIYGFLMPIYVALKPSL